MFDGSTYDRSLEGASFLAAKSTAELAHDATEYTVQINRISALGDLSVPITAVDGSGLNIFSTPSTATFKDGENITYLKISIVPSNAVVGKGYSLKLTLGDEVASPTGIKSLTIAYTKQAAPEKK